MKTYDNSMKIIVPKGEFIAQLPERLEDLPKQVIIEGAAYFDRGEVDPVAEGQFEALLPILTRREWLLFRELATHGHASRRQLERYLRTGMAGSNAIAVHMKNIRQKLRRSGLPYNVRAHRDPSVEPGGYELIQIDHGAKANVRPSDN